MTTGKLCSQNSTKSQTKRYWLYTIYRVNICEFIDNFNKWYSSLLELLLRNSRIKKLVEFFFLYHICWLFFKRYTGLSWFKAHIQKFIDLLQPQKSNPLGEHYKLVYAPVDIETLMGSKSIL